SSLGGWAGPPRPPRPALTKSSHRLAGALTCGFRYPVRAATVGRTVRGGAVGTTAGIDYRLLGTIEAGVNGHVLDIGGPKQRGLRASLLLSANQPEFRQCPPRRCVAQAA